MPGWNLERALVLLVIVIVVIVVVDWALAHAH